MKVEAIENSAALTSIFGEWPSFHDAEVVSLYLDRSGADGPFLEARVHVFKMTKEVDAKGFFVLRDHTLVTLRFSDVDVESISSFNSQNALMTMIMDETDDARRFQVEMQASYGCDARFTCASVRVVAATPYVPAD